MDATPSLDELTRRLSAMEAKADHAEAYAVRQLIAQDYPTSEAATCARYKMGLDRLFRARDLAQAAQLFEEAAGDGHPFWSAAARTSLGLCLVRMGRAQKGMLELRKVGFAPEPSQHSAAALGFMEAICMEGGQVDEGLRLRKERIRQLEFLVARGDSAPPEEVGLHLYQLATALRDQGETERARQVLSQGVEMGAGRLGDGLFTMLSEAAAQTPA